MPPQISKEAFASALMDLGHDPAYYRGKRLSLTGMSELYEMNPDSILEAIQAKQIGAHYDYTSDTIWVDALDAAHFYFCVKSETSIMNS